MILESLSVGPLNVNCYILAEGEGGAGVVIDPGGDHQRILDRVGSLSVSPKFILNTHGHFDHILAVGPVREATGAEFLVHSDERQLLAKAKERAAVYVDMDVPEPPEPDGFFQDGEVVSVGRLELEVMHTPGHSAGSVCFYGESKLFSGDTLFAGSVGRTDRGGSREALQESLRKLIRLPGDTEVYPGHGPSTLLAEEKKSNPFLKQLL